MLTEHAIPRSTTVMTAMNAKKTSEVVKGAQLSAGHDGRTPRNAPPLHTREKTRKETPHPKIAVEARFVTGFAMSESRVSLIRELAIMAAVASVMQPNTSNGV